MQWLKQSEAAEILGLSTRTIKRWLRVPPMRGALLGAREGKQWRIPRPQCLAAWRADVLLRLGTTGLPQANSLLDKPWKKEIDLIAAKNEPYWKEVRKLYFAASLKALGEGRITTKVKEN